MSQIWTIAETHPVPPCTVVIFGASGDLAARKLLPALYNLEHCGKEAIPPKSAILGFARREMSVDAFRTKAREAAERYSRLKIDEAMLATLRRRTSTTSRGSTGPTASRVSRAAWRKSKRRAACRQTASTTFRFRPRRLSRRSRSSTAPA